MAETEITVSMGDVVVMKSNEEEDAGDDSNKEQVIIQLQDVTPLWVTSFYTPS